MLINWGCKIIIGILVDFVKERVWLLNSFDFKLFCIGMLLIIRLMVFCFINWFIKFIYCMEDIFILIFIFGGI